MNQPGTIRITSVPPVLMTLILTITLQAAENPIVKSEFIYTDPPTPSCHASTIAQSGDRLLAAWFGGKDEGDPSVGIWLADYDGSRWSKPVEVASGQWEDGKRYPCWNPVLFQSRSGPLMLFYKVGPTPRTWWGMLITSTDAGQTWSKPTRLPEGILGPIKNKPSEQIDGPILCGSSTEHQGWRLHMEFTPDHGKTWTKTPPLNDGKQFGAIQPSFLTHEDGTLQLLCRSRTSGRILTATSKDAGKTWAPLANTDLPNPNSGIDAVTLAGNRHLLVYNHTPKGRSPLTVAISSDGQKWKQVLHLEDQPGEYSYPAVIQTKDQMIHITYTWKREKIKHVVLDPSKLPSN